MKTPRLNLSEIVTTAGTQIRAKLCTDTVDDYAIAMEEGAEFPPVVVFHDGNRYILADGFHRVMAATRNGYKDISVDIRKGSKSDALRYALGANASHGLPRTNKDKLRSIELAIVEWPKLGNPEIAKRCAVSDEFVRCHRNEIQVPTVGTCDKRTGADGKQYPAHRQQSAAGHACSDCGAKIDSTAAHFTGKCRLCYMAQEERPHIKTEEETRPGPEEEIISKGFKKLDFGKELEHFYAAFERLKAKCQDRYDYEALDEQLKGMQEEAHKEYLAHKSLAAA